MSVFHRYVAVGDSSTEGLDDPDPRGGYRGWSRRLAATIAAAQDEPLRYANLAVRGRRTGRILGEQLEPALAMEPDLVTLFCGTNDAVTRRFDVRAYAADLERLQGAFTRRGATVVGFTMPDLAPVVPALSRWLRPRMEAMNDVIRTVSERNGALVLDLAEHPVASDPRLWSDDRLHANGAGHARIAAALAWRLGVPGASSAWTDPLPPPPPPSAAVRCLRELRWWGGHFLPWLLRHARGRSSGDGLGPSCPELVPFGDAVSGSVARRVGRLGPLGS